MKLKLFISLLLGIFFTANLGAQDVAVKTNLLYDATASINVGAEIGLASKWTFDLSGNFNAWKMGGDKKWKHWFVQPEVRYWFCDRFAGHFVGAHLIGGQYNIGGIGFKYTILGSDIDKQNRFQGWFGGIGLAYGYTWILGKHWNLEAEIGLGYMFTRYDKFECAGCGKKVAEDVDKHYVGPTKAALNLVYVF